MIRLEDKDLLYLKWLYNRLVYRYGIDTNSIICKHFESIINKLQSKYTIDMSDGDLDKIIHKYYIDFFMDKSETMGYDEDERVKIRTHTRNICEDIINNNIPSNKIF